MRSVAKQILLAAAVVIGVTLPAAAQQQSLYERLGGQPAITAVVDQFVANVAADKRINTFFASRYSRPQGQAARSSLSGLGRTLHLHRQGYENRSPGDGHCGGGLQRPGRRPHFRARSVQGAGSGEKRVTQSFGSDEERYRRGMNRRSQLSAPLDPQGRT
jgi:hypothetical protein